MLLNNGSCPPLFHLVLLLEALFSRRIDAVVMNSSVLVCFIAVAS